VDLLRENEQTARLYMLCQGQVVTVGEQVIDINHNAVWEAIKTYKIDDPITCFELITRVFHHFLKKHG
jgi:hypothetical protein